MRKDKTIINLIDRLKLIIDFALLEVVDYWDADLCAIGLKKENRLIYISSFNYVENKVLRFDFDLEVINEVEQEKNEIIKKGRGVLEVELISEVKQFLEV